METILCDQKKMADLHTMHVVSVTICYTFQMQQTMLKHMVY